MKLESGDRESVANKQGNHWFYYALLGIRTVWYLLGINHIISNADEYAEGDVLTSAATEWFVLLWFTLSFAVPVYFFLEKKLSRFWAILAEIVLSGGFFCFAEYNSSGAFAFFNFPALMLGFMSAGLAAIVLSSVSIAAVPLLVLVLWQIGWESTTNMMLDMFIVFGIGCCFRMMVASYEKRKEMYDTIEKQNKTLEVYAKQIKDLTLLEERNRMARELHDTVGHTFTTAITGMDAVYYLIDIAPHEAKRSLKELLAITRNGLDEVRKSIHQIAPEQEERELSVLLKRVAEEFATHTDTEVEFQESGEAYDAPEAVRLTAVRCLQESLTNAKKHGMASAIRIRLVYGRESIELTVVDNGKGAELIVEGFGLRAMSERAANVNGAFQISSVQEQGTTINIQLPVRRKPVEA